MPDIQRLSRSVSASTEHAVYTGAIIAGRLKEIALLLSLGVDREGSAHSEDGQHACDPSQIWTPRTGGE